MEYFLLWDGTFRDVIPPDSRDYLVLLVIGLLVVLGPVVVLALTLGALVLFGDLALGRITPVEFLELYVLDLVVLVVLASVFID